jgi:hypothetical protein
MPKLGDTKPHMSVGVHPDVIWLQLHVNDETRYIASMCGNGSEVLRLASAITDAWNQCITPEAPPTASGE